MKSKIILILTAMIAAIGLSGCASMDSSNTKNLLIAAGFREKTPETAEQKELYARAPAYQVQRIRGKGKHYYVYRDERNGTVLVGSESNLQQFEKLAVPHRITHGPYGYYIDGPPRGR